MISRVKEELFYEKTVEQYPDLKQWIAGYHGTKEIHMEGIDGKFMILDDLTFGYDKPSVIDLKIGTQTWEEDASKEKIERESKKYPLQRTFGFRLTGMRVYNKEKKDYDIYDKKYGYSITEDTLNGMFALFFSQVDPSERTAVIQSVIDQLRPLLSWFEVPGRLRFICSSILIILEGGSSQLKPIVRLVDFAHVKQLPPTERDEGCIIGIQRILSELSLLVSFCVCYCNYSIFILCLILSILPFTASQQTPHVLHSVTSPFCEYVTIRFPVGECNTPNNSCVAIFRFSSNSPSSARKQ